MTGKHVQLSLFEEPAGQLPDRRVTIGTAVEIDGLSYIREFVSVEMQDRLLAKVDGETWLADLKRRVQHYGYKYDYKSRHINYSMRIGRLPEWAEEVTELLCQQAIMAERADQLIVNEYLPGQGIASHIDCVPCFTDTIASLSLGSSCVMNFTNNLTKRVIPVLLEPGSLVVLRGDARYAWTHGIASRKSDQFQGRSIPRGRRVSLTFRKVILDQSQD